MNPGGKNLPKRLTHLYLSQSKRFPKIFKNNCGDVYSGPKGGSGGAVGGSAVGRRQRCAGSRSALRGEKVAGGRAWPLLRGKGRRAAGVPPLREQRAVLQPCGAASPEKTLLCPAVRGLRSALTANGTERSRVFFPF